MTIIIQDDLQKLASQYPLSYREIYALNSCMLDKDSLELAIQQITSFGMSVEEYLIKICHLRPQTVQDLLYQPCEYTYLTLLGENNVNNVWRKYCEIVAKYCKNKNKKELT